MTENLNVEPTPPKSPTPEHFFSNSIYKTVKILQNIKKLSLVRDSMVLYNEDILQLEFPNPGRDDDVLRGLISILRKTSAGRSNSELDFVSRCFIGMSPIIQQLQYDLDPTTFKDVFRELKCISLPAGKVLFHHGDIGTGWYLSLSGSLLALEPQKNYPPIQEEDQLFEESYTKPNGVDMETAAILKNFPGFRLTNELGFGHEIGELGLKDRGKRTATIVAKESAHLAFLSPAAYKRLIGQSEEHQRKVKIDFLRSILLFHNWSLKQLEVMLHHIRVMKWPRNHVIYTEGDRPNKIFLIKEGEVTFSKVFCTNTPHGQLSASLLQEPAPPGSLLGFRSAEEENTQLMFTNKDIFRSFNLVWMNEAKKDREQRIEVARLGSGSFFGEEALLASGGCSSRAVCYSDVVEVWTLSREKFLEMSRWEGSIHHIKWSKENKSSWRESYLLTANESRKFLTESRIDTRQQFDRENYRQQNALHEGEIGSGLGSPKGIEGHKSKGFEESKPSSPRSATNHGKFNRRLSYVETISEPLHEDSHSPKVNAFTNYRISRPQKANIIRSKSEANKLKLYQNSGHLINRPRSKCDNPALLLSKKYPTKLTSLFENPLSNSPKLTPRDPPPSEPQWLIPKSVATQKSSFHHHNRVMSAYTFRPQQKHQHPLLVDLPTIESTQRSHHEKFRSFVGAILQKAGVILTPSFHKIDSNEISTSKTPLHHPIPALVPTLSPETVPTQPPEEMKVRSFKNDGMNDAFIQNIRTKYSEIFALTNKIKRQSLRKASKNIVTKNEVSQGGKHIPSVSNVIFRGVKKPRKSTKFEQNRRLTCGAVFPN